MIETMEVPILFGILWHGARPHVRSPGAPVFSGNAPVSLPSHKTIEESKRKRVKDLFMTFNFEFE